MGQRGVSDSEVCALEKKRGSRLGSGTPKGRVPLIRPRRDRIMGSSILASLSEAGGNDPVHPASRPLPPHLPDVADRVGTRPTHPVMQLDCPFLVLVQPFHRMRFQQLIPLRCSCSYKGKSDSGFPSRFGAAPLFSVLSFRAPLPSRLVHSFSLAHNVRGILTV